MKRTEFAVAVVHHCIFLRVALAPFRGSGSRRHRFRLESRGRGFSCFRDSRPWMRDSGFLAPAIIPRTRSHWRYRRDTCCRHNRTTAFVFRWIRIVRSLINSLSLYSNRRISHARHGNNRCFRKSCLTEVLTATACT